MPHYSHIRFLLPFILWFLALAGCSHPDADVSGSCGSCHEFSLDANHLFACTVCHRGNPEAPEKSDAHNSLLARPAHPDHLDTTCGQCHQEAVSHLTSASHYTLANEVNMVRTAFGAKRPLTSLEEIPEPEHIEHIGSLVDDMLRRRCLRCHLFTPGDDYTATRRGTGCSACHLEFSGGKLSSHQFIHEPGDAQCLSCHYGNRVGFDYYGRFEHDLHHEYRTPYSAADTTERPYGVDYHELEPDIHQQRGLLCIDCHSGAQLMKSVGENQKVDCTDCHDKEKLEVYLPPGVQEETGKYTFTSKKDDTQHNLPLMKDSAHTNISNIGCQACHAQWSFNDVKTHLLRSDVEEYYPWAKLTVQGSSELEYLLNNNLDFDKTELAPYTTDTLSGKKRLGIWYKGYTMRRWETLPLGRDDDGKVHVVRPELNLAISYIDENEDVIFDSYESMAPNGGMIPYTPHTTGKAGLNAQERLRKFFMQEQTDSEKQ